MPIAQAFLLAVCGILAAGALIVACAVWREARRREDARARREATALAWGETAADDTRP